MMMIINGSRLTFRPFVIQHVLHIHLTDLTDSCQSIITEYKLVKITIFPTPIIIENAKFV